MSAQTETKPDAEDESEPADESKKKATKRGALDPYLPGRREAMFLIGGGLLGAAVTGGGAAYALRPPESEVRDDREVLSFREGRERLEAGNRRYVAGESVHPDLSAVRRAGVSKSQAPFAVVFSCADSRVPPEVIFDQGLGDLFVVRSAGQVIDHAVLGSLQYGVEHLSTPLLVVLGHSSCGAVGATIEAIEAKAKPSGSDIDALVASIRPAVIEAEETGADAKNLLSVSVDINVERTVEELKQAKLIGEASTLRKVKIVGAVYSLVTGEVNWL